MKKKLDMGLRILGVAMIMLLIKLLIDTALAMSEDMIMAIIAVIGSVSILFISVKMVLNTLERNAKMKIDLEFRTLKMNYYYDFLVALEQYLSVIDHPDQQKEAAKAFNREANRLNLYSTDDIINCVEQIRKTKKTDVSELYSLIRKDLVLAENQSVQGFKLSSVLSNGDLQK